jgi:hypothetical protein
LQLPRDKAFLRPKLRNGKKHNRHSERVAVPKAASANDESSAIDEINDELFGRKFFCLLTQFFDGFLLVCAREAPVLTCHSSTFIQHFLPAEGYILQHLPDFYLLMLFHWRLHTRIRTAFFKSTNNNATDPFVILRRLLDATFALEGVVPQRCIQKSAEVADCRFGKPS